MTNAVSVTNTSSMDDVGVNVTNLTHYLNHVSTDAMRILPKISVGVRKIYFW